MAARRELPRRYQHSPSLYAVPLFGFRGGVFRRLVFRRDLREFRVAQRFGRAGRRVVFGGRDVVLLLDLGEQVLLVPLPLFQQLVDLLELLGPLELVEGDQAGAVIGKVAEWPWRALRAAPASRARLRVEEGACGRELVACLLELALDSGLRPQQLIRRLRAAAAERVAHRRHFRGSLALRAVVRCAQHSFAHDAFVDFIGVAGAGQDLEPGDAL